MPNQPDFNDIDSFVAQQTKAPASKSDFSDIDEFVNSQEKQGPEARAKASSEMDRVLSPNPSGLREGPTAHVTTAPATPPRPSRPDNPSTIAEGLVREQMEQRQAAKNQPKPTPEAVSPVPGMTPPANYLAQRPVPLSGPSANNQPMVPMDDASSMQQQVMTHPGVQTFGAEAPTPEQAGYVMENYGPAKVVKGVMHVGEAVEDANPGQYVEPKKAARAASELMQGSGETMMPLVPEAILSAPVTTLAGMTLGAALNKGSQVALKDVQMPQEYKDAISDLMWFAPSAMGLKFGLERGANGEPIFGIRGFGEKIDPVTGKPSPRFAAAVGRTPEGGVGAGIKVGGVTAEGKFGGLGEAPGTTVTQKPAPALPAAQAEATAETADAIATQARATEAEHAAGNIRAGIPPQPTVPNKGELPPPSIENLAPILAKTIADVPEKVRPFAIQEVHSNLVDWMMQHGTIMDSDGQVMTITSEAQANKLADKWINDHLSKVDEAAANPPAPAEGPLEVKSEFTSEVTNRAGGGEAAPRSGFTEEPKPEVKPKRGDRVRFLDPDGNERIGTLRYLNDLAARIQPETGGGQITLAPSKVLGLAPAEASATEVPVSSQAPTAEPQKSSTESSSTPSAPAIVAPSADNEKRREDLKQQLGKRQGIVNRAANKDLDTFLNSLSSDEENYIETRTGLAPDQFWHQANGEEAEAAAEPEQQATKYKYGNTQAHIPEDSEAHVAIETARARIADEDLAGDGKDIGGNHVTVRYGIQSDDVEGIRSYLEQQEPFEATLGKTEAFKPSEHSDGAAPIIAPVEAPELHRIESELDQHGDFKERSFPKYQPHATVAYVKPEAAKKYTGMDLTHGKKFTVSSIAISDRNGNVVDVPLKGKAQQSADDEWTPKPGEVVNLHTSAVKGSKGIVIKRFKHNEGVTVVPLNTAVGKELKQALEAGDNARVKELQQAVEAAEVHVSGAEFSPIEAKADNPEQEAKEAGESQKAPVATVAETDKAERLVSKQQAATPEKASELPNATWMNPMDIEQAQEEYKDHPVLGKATQFLREFQEEVDAHSDGWPYWKLPIHAANKMMSMIEHPELANEATLRAALAPIKRFYSLHGKKAGMQWPKAIPQDEAKGKKAQPEDGTRTIVLPVGAAAPEAKPSATTQAVDTSDIIQAPQEAANERGPQQSTAGGNGSVRASDGASGKPLGGVPAQASSEAPRGGTPAESPDGRSDELHTSDAAVSESRDVAGSSGGDGSTVDSAPAGEIVRQAAEDEAKAKKSAAKKNTDWYAHPEDFSVDATNGQRLEWNIAAIKLLKEITENPRKLTAAERDALAHYVGWGALQDAFDPYNSYGYKQDQWARAYKQLKELLSEDEFDRARSTVTDAHYTSPAVVRFMWQLASRFGLKGGSILESSMGVGNFLGMMPKAIRNSANVVGNEIDPTTYGIAKLLYPSASLYNKDFVQLLMPDDSFDLAIGNPPFGGQGVFDPNYRKLGKPKIHDYFFIKTLDKVRPGGLLMYVTSAGTLDKTSSTMRLEMAERADLITAYRLPSSTFEKNAGTSVITDVLIFRRRAANTEYAGEPFTKTVKVELPYGKEWSYKEGQSNTMEINEYFQKHPENVLGEMTIGRGGTHHEPERMTVDTDDLQAHLDRVLKDAPRNVLQTRSEAMPVFEADTDLAFAPSEMKDGAFTVDDKGNVVRNVGGKLVKAKEILDAKTGKPSPAQTKRMKSLIGLRDDLRSLMYEMRTQPDDDTGNAKIAKLQKDLLKQYEKHVYGKGGSGKKDKKGDTKYDLGFINSPANRKVFGEDPEYDLIAALEDYNPRKRKGTPTDIFTQRTLHPPAKLTSLSQDNKEAFYQILGERGRADLDYMAELSGKSVAELAAQLEKDGLVYQDPITGQYQSSEKYLSGHVYEKLEAAEKALEQTGDKKWQRNIDAVKAIIPPIIPINSPDPKANIEIKLGATWIAVNAVKDFARDVLKAGYEPDIRYASGVWLVPNMRNSAEITNEYAGGGMRADYLLELALNQRQPVVKIDVEDGVDSQGKPKTKEVVDPKATAGARKAQDKIKAAFSAYLREHPTWAQPLEESYNRLYNGLVPPKYNGSHLTFPGMNKAVLRDGKMMPHQSDAVWRIMQEGRALLAHVVGAGKTYEMIASAMEMKRLGMIRKPMVAVPNHIVQQWARDWKKLYPGARILAPTKNDFTQANRRKLLGRIATGNWDGVIVAHSQFNMMDISPERQMVTFQRQMDELEDTIRGAQAAAGGGRGAKNDRTVKQLEKSKKSLKAKMDALADFDADQTIVFDELGVDQLYIDEAHNYKNLMFHTKMDRISGLSQSNSKRALRLKMKTEYLLEKHGNRGVVFATGTPVSNTMAELRHMIAYLAPDIFEKAGIHYFDEWAANFGDTFTAAELSADGRTYKPRTKFARFTNLPELQLMFRTIADVKLAQDLNLPTPELETGHPIPFEVPATEEVKQYVDLLVRRAKALRGEPVPVTDEHGEPVMVDQLDNDGKPTGKKIQATTTLPKPDPTVDNMLKITSDGIKAATDMRLHGLPDNPGSKINALVDQIYELWKESSAVRPDPLTGVKNTTGLVFLDNFQLLDRAIEVPEKYQDEWDRSDDDHRRKMIKDKKVKRSEEVLLNLYEDMRAKLVKLGVPKEQMAIIHEYKSDNAKADLFEKINNGDVRVLFGSRAKMGAGMNAQKRMRWLIDVDSPWRPGDLEQGHGRLVRQGNLNSKVKIYWAVTKGSFDAYRIQTLKTKAQFIGQVMSGKTDVRSCIDAAADSVMSYEDMMAASSDNPDVKRQFDIQAELTNLRYAKDEFDSQRYQAARQADGERHNHASNIEWAEHEEAVHKAWTEATEGGKKFSATILGEKFDKFGDAEKFLKGQKEGQAFIFKMNGLEFEVAPRWDVDRANLKSKYVAKHDADQASAWDKIAAENAEYIWKLLWNGKVYIGHIIEGLQALPASISASIRHYPESAKRNRGTAAQNLVEAAKYDKLAANTTFTDQKRIDELEKELDDVNRRLGIISDEDAVMEQQVDAEADNSMDDDFDEAAEDEDESDDDAGDSLERRRDVPSDLAERERFIAEVAHNMEFREEPRQGNIPGFISGDENLMDVLAFLRGGKRIDGVVLGRKASPIIATLAEKHADFFQVKYPDFPRAASRLRALAGSIRKGLSDSPLGVAFTSSEHKNQANVIAEELFHLYVQYHPGYGDFRLGTPWEELQYNPAFVYMRPRIIREYGDDPSIQVAEGIVDVWNDEAHELDNSDKLDFALEYFRHAPIEALENAVELAEHLKSIYGQKWSGYGSPAQEAIKSVREERSGEIAGRNRSSQDTTEKLGRQSLEAEDGRGTEQTSKPERSGTHQSPARVTKQSLARRREDEPETSFGMTVPGLPQTAEAIGNFWKADIAPHLESFGMGIGETARLLAGQIYPRIEESSFIGRKLGLAVKRDAMDSFMQLKGDRDRAIFMLEEFGKGVKDFFDHISEASRIDFLDHYKTGRKQATPDLDELAKFYRVLDDAMYQMVEQYKPGLNQLENHFRMFWEKLPNPVDEDGNLIEKDQTQKRNWFSKRPLEGSKGMLKKHTLETASEGLARGGKLVSTNPQTLFELGQMDSLKFITAHQLWDDLGTLGHRVFARSAKDVPDGFRKLDDKIAKVYFPAEVSYNPESEKTYKVPLNTGEWYVEENSHRILSNFLSRDIIREHALGRGLLWLKNVATAVELGLSPFHAVFETIEAMGSQVGIGLTRVINQGVRQGDMKAALRGLAEIASAPVAPVSMAGSGSGMIAYGKAKARQGNILGVEAPGNVHALPSVTHSRAVQWLKDKAELMQEAKAGRFLKEHPDADILLNDLFAGGAQLSMSHDYDVNTLKTLREQWTARNPIGAAMRAFPWLASQMMAPLFKWYIPRLKVGFWLKQYAQELEERAADLTSGKLTRPELARQVWQSTENRFGEMNFDNLWWNRTFKTALQMAFRSVTWKGGNIGLFAGGTARQVRNVLEWVNVLPDYNPSEGGGSGGNGGDGGKGIGGDNEEPREFPKLSPRLDRDMAWIFGLMFTTVMMGTIVCKVSTGKYPWEFAKEDSEDSWNYVKQLYTETIHPRSGQDDYRGKPIRFSLPTYWKDFEHGSQSPRHYIVGSFSTTLSRTIDVMENRDFRDNYVYNPNDPSTKQMLQILRYSAPKPFSLENYLRMKEQGGGSSTAVPSAFGFTRASSSIDLTPAEQHMIELKRASKEPFTPEQIGEFEARRLRRENGELTREERRRYAKDEHTPYAVKLFKGLPYEQARDVFNNYASDDERHMLKPLLDAKRARILKANPARVRAAEEEE